MKIKTILGIGVIALGLFLEVVWLGICFGTVVVGILLLIFAPGVLFFPFNFFLIFGLSIMGAKTHKTNFKYQQYSYNHEDIHQGSYERYDDLDKYYKILESHRTDSLEMIKANYRRLIKEYHYDFIASKNLPEDMIIFAKEKTQSLNEAYAKIKEVQK